MNIPRPTIELIGLLVHVCDDFPYGGTNREVKVCEVGVIHS